MQSELMQAMLCIYTSHYIYIFRYLWQKEALRSTAEQSVDGAWWPFDGADSLNMTQGYAEAKMEILTLKIRAARSWLDPATSTVSLPGLKLSSTSLPPMPGIDSDKDQAEDFSSFARAEGDLGALSDLPILLLAPSLFDFRTCTGFWWDRLSQLSLSFKGHLNVLTTKTLKVDWITSCGVSGLALSCCKNFDFASTWGLAACRSMQLSLGLTA